MVPKLVLVAFLVTALLHPGVGQASSGNSSSTTTTTTTSTTTESPKTHSTTTKPTPTNATTTTPTTTTTPSTTTAPIPTTKPTPPPVFPKNLGDWSVVDPITNITCIHVTGAIEIHVSIKDSENNKTVDFKVDVPASAKEDGNCGKGDDEQRLVLDWETESDNAKNSLEFTFARNSTTKKYRLDSINGKVYVTPKNATKEEEVVVNLENLDAHQLPLNKSYKCTSEETIKTKSADNVQIKLANIQMEAFRVSNTTGYSTPEECAADGYVADIVPIAVGCSLAGLVVIVLIAYLFGRRRARARGYQSV